MPKPPHSASLTRSAPFGGLATRCNGFCNGLPAAITPPGFGRGGISTSFPAVLALANATDADQAKLLGLANELEIGDDGWALIPYGESVHSGKDGRTPRALNTANATEPGDSPRPVVQVFERADAEAMVADFYSPVNRFKRFIVGLPIFRGHPDAPRWAKFFPDKTPRGTIAEMEATERGLRFRPVLHENGREEVSAGWSRFSPYWRSVFGGVRADGFAIYRPNKLWSIGLLPPGRENIAGLSLANAGEPVAGDTLDQKTETETHMNWKALVLKLLGLLKISVPADATDEQIGSAVEGAGSAMAAANAKDDTIANLTREKQALADQLAAATTKTQQAELALSNAKEAHTAEIKKERAARAKLIVGVAVTEGRIPAAEMEPQSLALANATDFESEAARVAALPKKLKTQSALGDLSTQGKEQQGRQQTVLNLVNARMEKNGESYDTAFAAVMKDPANAALTGAMKKPEAKA